MPDAVISIKSRFADLILDGEKTYEVRKTLLPTQKGKRFFIYSSGRDKKVVGQCSLYYDPMDYWFEDNEHFEVFLLSDLGISLDEYRKYLNGKEPFHYLIHEVVRYPEPLDLVHFGLTHAPQSWCYAKCIPANLMGGDL